MSDPYADYERRRNLTPEDEQDDLARKWQRERDAAERADVERDRMKDERKGK
jgi:hypothetical protein